MRIFHNVTEAGRRLWKAPLVSQLFPFSDHCVGRSLSFEKVVAYSSVAHYLTNVSVCFIQLSKNIGESVLLSCERQVAEQKRGGLKQIILCLFCRCYSSFISKSISKLYIIFISASLIRPFNSISTTICTFPYSS